MYWKAGLTLSPIGLHSAVPALGELEAVNAKSGQLQGCTIVQNMNLNCLAKVHSEALDCFQRRYTGLIEPCLGQISVVSQTNLKLLVDRRRSPLGCPNLPCFLPTRGGSAAHMATTGIIVIAHVLGQTRPVARPRYRPRLTNPSVLVISAGDTNISGRTDRPGTTAEW